MQQEHTEQAEELAAEDQAHNAAGHEPFADEDKALENCRKLLALAEEAASQIGGSQIFLTSVQEIVGLYCAIGDVDKAAEMADGLEDPFLRDKLLAVVVERCAQLDDDEYANQLIEAIDDYGIRNEAAERFAITKARKGKKSLALEAARTMDHPDNVLAELAAINLVEGKSEEANSLENDIEYKTALANAYLSKAFDLIKAAHPDKAVELLERASQASKLIELEEERIGSLINIAEAMNLASRRDKTIKLLSEAGELAEKLENLHRDQFLSEIAVGYYRANSKDLSEIALESIADKTQAALAYLGMAKSIEEPNSAEKEDFAQEAAEILKSENPLEIKDSRSRNEAIFTCAEYFTAFSNVPKALEILDLLFTVETKQAGLLRMLKASALKGDLEEFRLILDEFKTDLDKSKSCAISAISTAAFGNKANTEKIISLGISYLEKHLSAEDSVVILIEFLQAALMAGKADLIADLMSRLISTLSQIRSPMLKVRAMIDLAGLSFGYKLNITENALEKLENIAAV